MACNEFWPFLEMVSLYVVIRVGGLEGWKVGGLEEWRVGGMEGWRVRGLEGLNMRK